MKTGRVLLITGIVAILVVIYFNKCNSEKKPSQQQGAKSAQPMLLSGVIIHPQNVANTIFSSGTLMANDEVEIRNEISGKITSILFKEGTHVKKGDVLVKIYDEDLRAQLRKLQSQKNITAKNEERQKDLLSVSGISEADYEAAQNQVSSIDADIDLIESDLSKTVIRAPFDGTIGLRSVSNGAFLEANTPIATIQALDIMKLDFSVPERYKSLMKDNSEIYFTTQSSEGRFTGKVYAYEPKIDLQTRSVLLRAVCDNKSQKLFPGAFAHVEIPLMEEKNALLVPTQSLIPELKGQSVFIVKNGKAQKTSVETGSRNDSTIVITSGVSSGDTVLTTGMMQVKQGVSVKVKVSE